MEAHRRSLAVLTALFFLLCFGCTPSKNLPLDRWVKGEGKVKVLATTAIVGQMVQAVGGEDIDLLILIGKDLDPHSYEMVKGDTEKFRYADLVFSNGLLLEHSASMQRELSLHKGSIRLGDEIAKKYPNEIIFVQGQVDPHIWMDISLWAKGIDPIVEALCQKNPKHCAAYEKRGEELKTRLATADLFVEKRIGELPENKRYLVTSHDAFNYFGRRYLATKEELITGKWHERVRAIQGLAPDEQISPLEILEIVNHLLKWGISVIFPEANLSQDALKKVVDSCKRKGKKVCLCKEALYGDTLGNATYVEMMEHNANVIVRCIQEKSCE